MSYCYDPEDKVIYDEWNLIRIAAIDENHYLELNYNVFSGLEYRV